MALLQFLWVDRRGNSAILGDFEGGEGQNPGLPGVWEAHTGPGSVGRVERRTRLLLSCG